MRSATTSASCCTPSAQATERQHLVEELLEARRRNEFLLLATQVLSEVVDYREMVERLAQVSVPVMADLCLIDIEDEDGQMRRMAAWHADPDKRALTEELRASYPPDAGGVHPTMEVMRSGRSMWSAEMDDDFLRATSRDERHFAILEDARLHLVRHRAAPPARRTGPRHRHPRLRRLGPPLLREGPRPGRAAGRAGQLRRHPGPGLRPRAPDLARAAAAPAARRHPCHRRVGRGGPLPAGGRRASRSAATGTTSSPSASTSSPWSSGDVEGHDLGAARIMSRLRHTLGLLLLEERAPGKALQRLNRVSLAGVGGRLATALVGVLNTRTGSIAFSSAGHPSPVRVESGQAVELPVPPGPPLGVQHCHYKDHEFHLDRGCLVMFTDGLVERRGSHLDERLALLESSLRASPSNEPGRVADFVIDAMTADARSSDDIVVLTARRQAADPGLI